MGSTFPIKVPSTNLSFKVPVKFGEELYVKSWNFTVISVNIAKICLWF